MKTTFCDNIVIHCYPNSPYIAKAQANFRMGHRIVWGIVMRDLDAIMNYMQKHSFCDGIQYKIINHN